VGTLTEAKHKWAKMLMVLQMLKGATPMKQNQGINADIQKNTIILQKGII
jgi:hypothetical protein